ncbi:MAG: DUF1553 domain-containing protein [Pirellulaceae bacterium]
MFNRPLKEDVKTKGDGQAESPSDAMHVVREGDATDLNVFIRGNVDRKGPVVSRRFLTVLSRGEDTSFSQGSGRKELAERIASRDNPLTARVFVNRVWGELIGQPLVASPSNFGQTGSVPTHPELLDELAVQFMDHGWSMKWLVRTIVQSSVYGQSSVGSELSVTLDPGNQWVSRMHRKRLSVEAWRDALVTASGTLSDRVGGPSEAIDALDADQVRRTLYGQISRFQLNSMLVLFDHPDANVHAAKRNETTTPLQKLFLMNSDFMQRQVDLVAQRHFLCTSGDSNGDATQQAIEQLYVSLLSRRPTPDEVTLGTNFLNAEAKVDRQGAWSEYVHAVLSSSEFLFVD